MLWLMEHRKSGVYPPQKPCAHRLPILCGERKRDETRGSATAALISLSASPVREDVRTTGSQNLSIFFLYLSFKDLKRIDIRGIIWG